MTWRKLSQRRTIMRLLRSCCRRTQVPPVTTTRAVTPAAESATTAQSLKNPMSLSSTQGYMLSSFFRTPSAASQHHLLSQLLTVSEVGAGREVNSGVGWGCRGHGQGHVAAATQQLCDHGERVPSRHLNAAMLPRQCQPRCQHSGGNLCGRFKAAMDRRAPQAAARQG